MLSYFLEKTVEIVNYLVNARGVYLILRVQGGGGGGGGGGRLIERRRLKER